MLVSLNYFLSLIFVGGVCCHIPVDCGTMDGVYETRVAWERLGQFSVWSAILLS